MFQLSFGLEFGLYSVSGEWTRARASFFLFILQICQCASRFCSRSIMQTLSLECVSVDMLVFCYLFAGWRFFSISLVCSQCLAISRAKAYNPFKFKAHQRTYIQIIHYIGNHSLTFCYKYMKCAISFFFIGWLFCVEHVYITKGSFRTQVFRWLGVTSVRESVSKCVSFATWTKVFGFEWDRFNQRLWCWCWFRAPCEILLANSVGRTSAYT